MAKRQKQADGACRDHERQTDQRTDVDRYAQPQPHRGADDRRQPAVEQSGADQADHAEDRNRRFPCDFAGPGSPVRRGKAEQEHRQKHRQQHQRITVPASGIEARFMLRGESRQTGNDDRGARDRARDRIGQRHRDGGHESQCHGKARSDHVPLGRNEEVQRVADMRARRGQPTPPRDSAAGNAGGSNHIGGFRAPSGSDCIRPTHAHGIHSRVCVVAPATLAEYRHGGVMD